MMLRFQGFGAGFYLLFYITQVQGSNITYCKDSSHLNVLATFTDQLNFKKENSSNTLVSCHCNGTIYKCTDTEETSAYAQNGTIQIMVSLSIGEKFKITLDGESTSINVKDVNVTSCVGKPNRAASIYEPLSLCTIFFCITILKLLYVEV